ncbi:transmembrane signal receptor [Lithospermum erythrorhizon]|uniref:Transmembrane signal receptor n=1 Tax=Lithospermum erythrorhizon TaxID=34254 RepID=A0AAV3NL00_LITER
MECLTLLCLICIFNLSLSQQFYDPTSCDSDGYNPGSRYTCDTPQISCKTFLVYRVNDNFQTIISISFLFNKLPSDDLLKMNNVTSSSEILRSGRDVILPVSCSCSDGFFHANVSYKVEESVTYSAIACEVFGGLVKRTTVAGENFLKKKDLQVGSILSIPLRCACPDNSSKNDEFDYLVTYPLVFKDNMHIVSKKFNVSEHDIWKVNNLEVDSTVYPKTTVLVPLKKLPSINFSIFPDVEPPVPGFVLPNPEEKSSRTHKEKLYVAGSVAGFTVFLSLFVVCVLYFRRSRKLKTENSGNLRLKNSVTSLSTPRTSSNSCLSPDFLTGIKYSLVNFGEGELRKATRNFCVESKLNDDVYKGVIDNLEVMIKELIYDDTRKIIDIHSKINHVNILRLIGICCGKNVMSRTYLVFELPSNGCLRDCLAGTTFRLGWHKRTQIAFDIATGLHYLHYCKVPSLTHLSTNSRNIFLTSKWRAKVAMWKASSLRVEESPDVETASSLSNPEKEDIFSFGMVLLELISGKENTDGTLLTEAIRLMGGEANEGGCFEQLRAFMDPFLKQDYPLAEALCLTVLAKACVEEDPMHRPCMDDIIKVLARMV